MKTNHVILTGKDRPARNVQHAWRKRDRELVKKWLSFLLIAVLTLPACQKEIATTTPQLKLKALAGTATAATTSTSDFMVVVLPDTQNYTSGYFGGTAAMFSSQINWIKNNLAAQNIKYVIGLGDIVEHGDSIPKEWDTAKVRYYSLEASNVPYGLAVGNHDQSPREGSILSVTTNQYNKYFGISHFQGRAYYGGHYPKRNNNNSHFDLFSGGGKDFIAIYMEYDAKYQDTSSVNNWADSLLNQYASRKAIVVTHYMATDDDNPVFSNQGYDIYSRLKNHANLFMLLGGHVYAHGGESYKENVYNGHTIRTYVSDYQQWSGGGNGRMRLMKFSVDNDDVTVKTYSPYSNTYETGLKSQFTKPLFGNPPSAVIADGKYKIVARHSGKALVVYNASTQTGANVVQWDYDDNGVDNDEWNITQIGTTGYYRITNVNSTQDMNVQGISTAVGGLVVQYPYNPAPPDNDVFGMISVGSGYYKIIAKHSGLCLNVAGANNTNGAQVKQWDYQGTTNEQFQLVPIPAIIP